MNFDLKNSNGSVICLKLYFTGEGFYKIKPLPAYYNFYAFYNPGKISKKIFYRFEEFSGLVKANPNLIKGYQSKKIINKQSQEKRSRENINKDSKYE